MQRKTKVEEQSASASTGQLIPRSNYWFVFCKRERERACKVIMRSLLCLHQRTKVCIDPCVAIQVISGEMLLDETVHSTELCILNVRVVFFNYQFCDVGCCCFFWKLYLNITCQYFGVYGKQTHNLLLAEINKVYSCIKHHCLFCFFLLHSGRFCLGTAIYSVTQSQMNCSGRRKEEPRKNFHQKPGLVLVPLSATCRCVSLAELCVLIHMHAWVCVCVSGCVNFEAIGFTAWAALLIWHQVQGSLKDGNCFPVACRNVSDSRTTALFFIWACGSLSEVLQLTTN